jgi:hypothetical protein
VLAGAGGQHAGQVVPVVRRGDHHRVEALVGEQLAVAGVGLHALVVAGLDPLGVLLLNGRLRVVEPLLDHVTHRDHLHLRAAEQAAEVVAAHRADADEADRDLLVGGQRRRARQDERGRGGRGEEGASGEHERAS